MAQIYYFGNRTFKSQNTLLSGSETREHKKPESDKYTG